MADASWNDPTKLKFIAAELARRRKQAAHDVRARIERRLAEIPPESPLWLETDIQLVSKSQSQRRIGLLSFMGYHVGAKGISERRRRKILDDVFNNEIPSWSDDANMQEWGRPQTSSRLQKLAEYLARFARARPNSSADLSVGIATWKSDLEYLKETFYDGKFYFPWPNTTEDPLRDDLLRQEAIRRGEEGERGWVTPEGVFFEADETDPTWPHGLGGHERAALCWLEANRRDLLDSLKKEIKAAGFERFEDTRGANMVKNSCSGMVFGL